MFHHLKIAALTAATLIYCTLRGASEPAPSSIKAGFAERDITPSVGMERPGGYRKVFHAAFHDPCKVRAAVFDDGKEKVVLVGVDALAVPRKVVLEARAQIQKLCKIPGRAVMIAASHSHSSGPLSGVLPGEFDDAPEDIRRLAYEESSGANPGYVLRVTNEIVQAVRAADAARMPAKLGFGFGQESGVAFNRRLRMKNGQSWSHPGAGNPDIVDYAGPVDGQVGVIGAWDMDGNLLGTVVNFSCHATTNPGGISANWIYYMERAIQGSLDSRAPVVFLAGASGDVTQVDNLSPFERPSGREWAQRVGTRVGAEAVKVLVSIPRSTDVAIGVAQKTWQIARRAPSPEKVASARAVITSGQARPDSSEALFAKETLRLSFLVTKEPQVEVEVQALQVGPAVFVSNPSEYFVQYGLDIKRGSKFPFTFPVSLANGSVGYVPTEEAFGPRGGGYETRLTYYSNLEITAGRQFAETGIQLANTLQPGPVPEFKRIASPGAPWPYGNNPPELN